ncbi:hypothetical protein Ava_B0293 (plasmid) [Trichormus variabilis ATCC 29413]|uniref:Uncharacterized protein n=3 Tax=Nostocales TaxID=1161 RepID=Q3M1Y2_TRIV2|nr:hypothetical protein Ava_B0293 [Trichormus variabilis ATCC 29413]MBC1217770.1 hypothetical protein [Trichormus variabilis ARAD]MBC1259272.1 hypothetical protein [Trichormus variabilis V5]MBC1270709.1 hypothetical protein [Trichormus variabilis FSR]MBC1305558.1 hypothetical protein [Trichormus variabilis N2B]MBC1314669.1 hypothetical protein [Trichormus variabilis PNB]MBC1329828.1 hypothetical protein [Trichormus variabilis 9RC]MBD2383498.1 hypothetical protein [Trichormus variabilis FACHB
MKFLNFLKLKPAQPTIESYGQASSGLEQQQIQSIMEWLFASLLNVGYFGKSHIIWHNGGLDSDLEQVIKKAMRRGEPVFLYRCGDRVSPLQEGFYWRMMDEHPSMRIYQLEIKDND